MDKERHRQQVEILKQQNRITEERIAILKEMERKLKQMVLEWRKAENKEEVMNQVQNLLFKKNEQHVNNKLAKKADKKYKEIDGEIKTGMKVKMKKNHQVGEVKEILRAPRHCVDRYATDECGIERFDSGRRKAGGRIKLTRT